MVIFHKVISGSANVDLNVPLSFCQRFKTQANCYHLGIRLHVCLNQDRDLLTFKCSGSM